MQLTEEQQRFLRQCFIRDAAKPEAFGEKEQLLLTKTCGQLFYQSLSDEVLIRMLQKRAQELGHSPSQKEVSDVFRTYLKKRFGKWPYALAAAGLATGGGAGGKSFARQQAEAQKEQEMLDQVRQKATALGRMPHPKDLPEVCQALAHKYKSWIDVLGAAGLDRRFLTKRAVHKIENPEPTLQEQLEKLKALSQTLGRAPMRVEVEEPFRKYLVKTCGSWRNALYQIGLEPVQHIKPFSSTQLNSKADAPRRLHMHSLQDCYYQVLDLSEQTQQDLETLRQCAESLGHPPSRQDVSKELRIRLQSACGSWSNALFQVGLASNILPKQNKKQGGKKV